MPGTMASRDKTLYRLSEDSGAQGSDKRMATGNQSQYLHLASILFLVEIADQDKDDHDAGHERSANDPAEKQQ